MSRIRPILGRSGNGVFVPILYQLPAFDAFEDFSDFVESINYVTSQKPHVFDVMKGLPINPFELPIDPLTGRKRPYIEMVFRLADTLNSVFAGSGDIQMGTLREAIDLCYRNMVSTGMGEPLPIAKQ